MTVRELIIKLGIKADTKDLEAVEKGLVNLKAAAADFAGFAAKVTAGLLGIAGAATLVTRETSAYAEEVDRSAAAFGIASDEYQRLRFGFQSLGASSDDLADALGTMTDRATDAMEGAETYKREFQRLGISIDELRDKNPAELFELWADAAQNAEDRNAAVVSGVRLLGDDLGRRLARGIFDATTGFKEYGRIAQAAGLIMDESQIKKAREAQSEFRLFGAVLLGVRRRLGLALSPAIARITRRLTALFLRLNDVGATGRAIDEFALRFEESLNKVAKFVENVDDLVQTRLGGWENVLRKAATSFGTFLALLGAKKFLGVLSALKPAVVAIANFGAIAIAKLLAVLAVVALLVLAVEDFWVFLNGGKSIFGELVDHFRESEGLLGALAQSLYDFWQDFLKLTKDLQSVWVQLKPVVMKVGKIICTVIVGALVLALIGVTQLLRLFMKFVRLIANVGLEMAKAVDTFFEVVDLIWENKWTELWEKAVSIGEDILGDGLSLLKEIGMATGIISDLDPSSAPRRNGTTPQRPRGAGAAALAARLAGSSAQTTVESGAGASSQSVVIGDLNVSVEGGGRPDAAARAGFETLMDDVSTQAMSVMSSGER